MVQHNDSEYRDSYVLMKFYMQRCPFCIDFQPEWNKLVEHYQNQSNILLAVIEGPKNPKIRQRYKIRGYPEVLFLYKGTKGLKAKTFDGGERDFDEIKEWVDENIEEFEEQQREREAAKNRKEPKIEDVDTLNG